VISELGNKQNYFQASAFLPPQTTLLGMLRHHLLMKKGWAFPQVEQSTEVNLKNLIGEKGFDPNIKNNYGVIEKISPVFLAQNNQGHYFICNKLFVIKNIKEENKQNGIEKTIEVKAEKSNGKSFGSIENSKNNFVLKLEGNNLTAKDFFDDYFINYDDITDKIKFSEVISQVLQTGNTKTSYRKEMSDDEAYYRFNYASINQHENINEKKEEKRFYRKKDLDTVTFILNDTFKFAFYAQLQSEELENKFNNVIIMGKEQSPFQIEIEKLTDIPLLFNPTQLSTQRVWLLSNLFSEDSFNLEANTNFICADSVPFRCFTKAINHDQRAKKWSFLKPTKTVEYSLYKHGGILYTEKIAELKAKVFDSASEWQAIGYNYFKTI
jgi:hypothetical protein